MKSLNLTQPLVLVMVGNPGAGKSFFARQFSEMFSIAVVSFDRIRFELFAKPTYSAEENDLVNRLAEYQIEELLKTSRSFIVDGGCNSRVDRTKLAHTAKQAGYGSLVVWVQTDAATCRARALKRNPQKRSDDAFNPSLSEQLFETFVRRFTEPAHEDHVVISGKHTYSTQARMVLRKIVTPREAEAQVAHRQKIEQTKQASQRPEGHRRSVVIG